MRPHPPGGDSLSIAVSLVLVLEGGCGPILSPCNNERMRCKQYWSYRPRRKARVCERSRPKLSLSRLPEFQWLPMHAERQNKIQILWYYVLSLASGFYVV